MAKPPKTATAIITAPTCQSVSSGVRARRLE
jgi:hypothetical protein